MLLYNVGKKQMDFGYSKINKEVKMNKKGGAQPGYLAQVILGVLIIVGGLFAAKQFGLLGAVSTTTTIFCSTTKKCWG